MINNATIGAGVPGAAINKNGNNAGQPSIFGNNSRMTMVSAWNNNTSLNGPMTATATANAAVANQHYINNKVSTCT